MDCYHCGDAPCPVESGFCHCGCGNPTPVATSHHYPSGTHWKYLTGHAQRDSSTRTRRKKLQRALERYQQDGICPYCGEGCPVGGGNCHCGCARPTSVIKHTHISQGRVKGMPSQYLNNHTRKTTNALSTAAIRQARYRYATQDITISDLAKEFGCGATTMHRTLLYEINREAGIDTSYKEVG